MPNDESRVMAIRAALLGTTATGGWIYVKELANKIVQQSVGEALHCKNREERNDLVLKAAALEEGFRDFFTEIESVRQVDTTATQWDLGELQIEQKDTADA